MGQQDKSLTYVKYLLALLLTLLTTLMGIDITIVLVLQVLI